MKLLSFLSTLLLFSSIIGSACAQQKKDKSTAATQEDACPPFQQETKQTLEYFISGKRLSGQNAPKKRKEWGLDQTSMSAIFYLKEDSDKLACRQLKKNFPWPVDNHIRGYYKSPSYYFIVDALKQPPPALKGKINFNTGSSIITVLDKEYNYVGSAAL